MRKNLILAGLFSLITFAVQAQDTSYLLYNYENMPKAVSVFQSRSRTFVGKIQIHAPVAITCTHTEKSSKDSKPIVNTLVLDGTELEFSPQRYVDHDITCALKEKNKTDGYIELHIKYRPEVLPDAGDEKRAQASLNDWLLKSERSQATLKLDMPPLLCEEKSQTPSLKVETGFIYRMTQGGEACTSPIAFSNGNIMSFCSKKIPSGDYSMEARAFSPLLKPLLKATIAGIETDTLRPKILKTKLNKELAIIHSISGKIAALDATGKLVFDVQLPVSWINTPAMFDGSIYVTSQDEVENSLFIVDSLGKITKDIKIPGINYSTLIINKEHILIGTDKAQVLQLNHSGEILKTVELATQLSHPGGQIKHLFLNQAGELLLATDKGEIAQLDLASETLTSLYLAPNDGKKLKMGRTDRDRNILDTPVVAKNGAMAFATDSRVHLLNPDGSLNKIIQTGNEFSIQSPVSLVSLKGEEHFWLGAMGQIYILNLDGIKKMEFSPYETHKSESMAENYSTPLVLNDGRILAGVYMGLRFFKLSTSPQPLMLENELTHRCE